MAEPTLQELEVHSTMYSGLTPVTWCQFSFLSTFHGACAVVELDEKVLSSCRKC
jgi:hypothetical protein